MASVTIDKVQKSFGEQVVLHDIELQIADGEFVVFVGPSGCGKSTLLRLIAGLETNNAGSISIDGQIVDNIAPSKRGVSMVFQSYALYPHMTVFNNMAFGLKQAGTPRAEIKKRVSHAADVLGLTSLLKRSPRALSGGQRQRVAIGRAIVREPRVFLFDEPLSNLDAALRNQTRLEIMRLHQRLGTTMIYVTHDQIEAMTLADRIVVLKDGRIEQSGSPQTLYHEPANLFVASFIGSPTMNFFKLTDLPDLVNRHTQSLKENTIIGVRPEHLSVTPDSRKGVTGNLELTENLGEYTLAHLITEQGTHFTAKVGRNSSDASTDMTKSLSFTVDDNNVHWFDPDSGLRLR